MKKFFALFVGAAAFLLVAYVASHAAPKKTVPVPKVVCTTEAQDDVAGAQHKFTKLTEALDVISPAGHHFDKIIVRADDQDPDNYVVVGFENGCETGWAFLDLKTLTVFFAGTK